MSASRSVELRQGKPSAIRTYAQAEAVLLGLVNYEVKPPPMRADTVGWHLQEFGDFLGRLGNPQYAAPIVHVAGTKGKGSTTRLLAAMLHSQGWRRVGAYTSPHIATFRERIAVNGRPISERDFVRALEAVRRFLPAQAAASEGFRTTFEVLTAMALWHFRRVGCDAVVLETGLGGRLDATNACPSRVAVLTMIGFDHQRVLGDTLGAIAAEKAGIVKLGTGTAVVGPQLPRRRGVVERVARAQARSADVPLTFFNAAEDPVVDARPGPWGFEVDLRIGGEVVRGVRLNALGRHQIDNLRTALLALEAFAREEKRPLHVQALSSAIARCALPGRMEVARCHPTVLLDAAHCGASARAAARALDEHFPGRPVALAIGVLGDKNLHDILRELAATAERATLVLTYAPASPRARTATDLAREARAFFPKVRACQGGIAQAMRLALAQQRRRPETVVIATGSTYGIADARKALAEEKDQEGNKDPKDTKGQKDRAAPPSSRRKTRQTI